MTSRIDELLRQRGAELMEKAVDDGEPVEKRLALAKLIAKKYPAFDAVRRFLATGGGQCDPKKLGERDKQFLVELCESGYGCLDGSMYRGPSEPAKKNFLKGGWLEDLVFHAVKEAGADAAVVRRQLHWVVQHYHGVSEIDVIARKNDRMLFVSCKSLKAEFEKNMAPQLMGALHEADNYQDHFGRPGDAAALVVTTDLIDEENNNHARYSALFGRALRLDVELITLEGARWDKLVSRFRSILANMG